MKLTYSEIAQLCRRTALLLHAGIGVGDGVFLLAEEEETPLRELLRQLGTALDEGEPFAAAMEKTGAFPANLTGMVRIGEETGHLEEVLEAMAQFYEQRSRSRSHIRNTLSYPALLLVLMAVVIGVLLVKVLPVFDSVYASLGSRLTGLAAGLLLLGRWLKGAMPWLFGLLVLAVLAALLYAYCAPLRNRVNSWCGARFGDRGVFAAFNNAHFARALAMGLGSALPLEDAVELAGSLLSDIPRAAERCGCCARLLQSGRELAAAMKEAELLPPAESRMLAVGLRQGSADKVMGSIADRLMEQAEEQLENMVAKIEPAMVLAASALVGAILLSVMLPLMNIMAVIG